MPTFGGIINDLVKSVLCWGENKGSDVGRSSEVVQDSKDCLELCNGIGICGHLCELSACEHNGYDLIFVRNDVFLGCYTCCTL